MYYTNMLPTDQATQYMLLGTAIAIVVLSLWLFRKMALSDHNKMLEHQAFAMKNPNKIEKIKLVDRREVYCVVTIADKQPEIIAQGVQAVRIFDKLVAANPSLAK